MRRVRWEGLVRRRAKGAEGAVAVGAAVLVANRESDLAAMVCERVSCSFRIERVVARARGTRSPLDASLLARCLELGPRRGCPSKNSNSLLSLSPLSLVLHTTQPTTLSTLSHLIAPTTTFRATRLIRRAMLVSSLLLSLSLFLFHHPQPTRARFPGVEQRFVEETLIDTGNLGLPDTGLVAAWGDVDSDQLVDLFYLSSDQRSISVYTWSRTAYEWKEKPESRIRTKSDFIIVNVVPGDFNYDGRLDVLLMGEKNPGGWWGEDETLQMQVYLQGADGSFSTSPSPLPYPVVSLETQCARLGRN